MNEFILKNYNKDDVKIIEITSTKLELYKTIRDKKQINNILSNLENIKLRRYYGSIDYKPKVYYYIDIYNNNYDDIFQILIIDNNYITINKNNNNYSTKYKIVDNTLNFEDMNKLLP